MLEILKFIKLMAVYTVFCTIGLFLSVFLASTILVLLRGDGLELVAIVSLSAKNPLLLDPYLHLAYFFLYVHRFFIDDKKD